MTDAVFGYGYDSTRNHITGGTLSVTTVNGSITGKDLLATNNSVTITAGENKPAEHTDSHVILHRIYVDNCDLTVKAAGDFRFDSLLVLNGSDLILAANKTIGMRENGGIY